MEAATRRFEEDTSISLEKAIDELFSSVSQLSRWCEAHYGEAFIAWVHIKAIRIFVESCLRYGLPSNYSSVLIKLKKESVKSKARKVLYERYKQLDSSGLLSGGAGLTGGSSGKSKEGAGASGGIGLAVDELFPYVSFEISAFAPKDR